MRIWSGLCKQKSSKLDFSYCGGPGRKTSLRDSKTCMWYLALYRPWISGCLWKPVSDPLKFQPFETHSKRTTAILFINHSLHNNNHHCCKHCNHTEHVFQCHISLRMMMKCLLQSCPIKWKQCNKDKHLHLLYIPLKKRWVSEVKLHRKKRKVHCVLIGMIMAFDLLFWMKYS